MDQTSHPLEQIRSSEVQESLPGVDNGPTQPKTNRKVMEAQIRASLEGIYAAIQAGQSTERLAKPSAETPAQPTTDTAVATSKLDIIAGVTNLDPETARKIEEARAKVAAIHEATEGYDLVA